MPILAVYCAPLSHAVTCPFSKNFQILYIFAKIFKYFALFRTFLRGHWFWNGGLRHLLNTSTWHSGKFQAVFAFFIFFFSLLYFLLTCTFKPWLLDSLDQPRYGSESHTQSNIQIHTQTGLDQCSAEGFVIKKLFVYLFMVKECLY